MKRCTTGLVAVMAMAMLMVPVRAQKQAGADALLAAARQKESVEGDLAGAIEEYKAIVAHYKDDRPITATALIRMAECYQKLGDTEAGKIYEQIVRDYADQREALTTARARLASLPAVKSADPATRRVWIMPPRAEIFGGTVSPDGRYIPYVDWAPEHHGDLFVHDLTTGADRRLTNTAGPGSPSPDDQFAEEASFSRDGKHLAYTWFDGKKDRYEIRIVGLQGTGVPPFRRVFDDDDIFWIAPHDWSPDGNWLAVSLHRRDRIAQIGLVGVASGSLRVLKTVDWRGPSRMAFSSDGRSLAYDLPANNTSDQRDVLVLALDGSRETPAVVDQSNDTLVGWSPDGQRLLFASDRSGAIRLWAQGVVGGVPQGSPELIKRDLGQSFIGVSASGALLSRSFELGSNIQIASLDFATGRFLRPPVAAVHTFLGSNRFPDWSPDGKSLAYVSWRGAPADRFVIGIRSVETGEVRELSPPLKGLGVYGGVSWSPDGQSFIAVGQDTKGRSGIFRIDAHTGVTSAVITRDRAATVTMPLQSPDQKSLYYNDAGRALMKRDLNSGAETELMRPAGRLNGLSLSPDGRYIAVMVSDPSTKANALLVTTSAGGDTRELLRRAAPERPNVYTWAPDSRSILVRMLSTETSFEIWRVPVDGSHPVKLDAMLEAAIRSVRLHPDGQQIAFQVDNPTKPAEVWLTENMIPPARRGK